MKLLIAPSAVADLDEIWAYLAKKGSIELAERIVNSLTHRFSLLARNPGTGRSRPELRKDVRSFPTGNYRIYYRPEKRGVVRILHIRHAARDERNLFR